MALAVFSLALFAVGVILTVAALLDSYDYTNQPHQPLNGRGLPAPPPPEGQSK
jgi:hypothetical protein